MKRILLGVLTLIVISACRKKELPVEKLGTGDTFTAQAELGPSYKYQMYFDLGTNTFVAANEKIEWDLGFSTKKKMIYLNSSKLMKAAEINNVSFESISDTVGYGNLFEYDHSSGNVDSVAIKNETIYIVDKGINEVGTKLGLFKMQIISAEANNYLLRIANLDGSHEETLVVENDQAYQARFLLWENAAILKNIEPPCANWDLQFTQYTHLFHEPEFTAYLVVGALCNRYATKARLIENIDFENLDLDKAMQIDMNENIDNIGYDWKIFNGNTYEIEYQKVYLIQDSEGYFYKLRFTDFYNNLGTKGYPTFEYQKL